MFVEQAFLKAMAYGIFLALMAVASIEMTQAITILHSLTIMENR